MRLRRQDGFTLPELLVAITVGSVVVLAAFALLDRSVVATTQTTDRVDSTQRGRRAMDRIARHLRSQVCPSPNGALVDGADGYSITFWAFFGTGSFTPEQHTIAWDPTRQAITERVDNAAGARTDVLLEGARLPGNVPLFSYYAYPDPPSGGRVEPNAQLGAPNAPTTALTLAERRRIARIDVNFAAAPTRALGTGVPPGSTHFSDQVFSRTADPNSLEGAQGPAC
jgi:prepilin-type N-terminal cleavage/methylation domain-containing protein